MLFAVQDAVVHVRPDHPKRQAKQPSIKPKRPLLQQQTDLRLLQQVDAGL